MIKLIDILNEIKVNDPRGKLILRGPISGLGILSDEDNPGFDGQDSLKIYKNHATKYFADQMNDGSKIEDYKKEIKYFEDYLKKLGIMYKIQEKTHASGFNYTNIQIPLDRIKFLPYGGDDEEEIEN